MKPSPYTPKREAFPGRSPIDVGPFAWFYEARGHIKVIVQLRNNQDVYQGTTHTAIPFKLLCRAVDRYRKYRAKRRTK